MKIEKNGKQIKNRVIKFEISLHVAMHVVQDAPRVALRRSLVLTPIYTQFQLDFSFHLLTIA